MRVCYHVDAQRIACVTVPMHNRAPTNTRNNDAPALIYYKHELVTHSPAMYRGLSSCSFCITSAPRDCANDSDKEREKETINTK